LSGKNSLIHKKKPYQFDGAFFVLKIDFLKNRFLIRRNHHLLTAQPLITYSSVILQTIDNIID